jgi:hypothetical protein
MVLGGRYGLDRPEAEAVRAAKELLYLFGADPECRADLARLYPQVVELLDVSKGYIDVAHSLKGLELQWQRVEAAIGTKSNAAVLREQLALILGQTKNWGLLCKWAPSSLLYALSSEHCRLGKPPDWSDPDPRIQPIFSSGLQDPRTSGYVGDFHFDPADPENPDHWDFQRTDGSSIIWDDGPPGFTVPWGASQAHKEELSREWDRQYEAIQENLRRQGMVDPKRWRKFDEAIYWLFLRLKTGFGWQRLTSLINEHPYHDDKPSVHQQWSNVAKRVRELQAILLIESRPEAKMHTAKFKESSLWNR